MHLLHQCRHPPQVENGAYIVMGNMSHWMRPYYDRMVESGDPGDVVTCRMSKGGGIPDRIPLIYMVEHERL